MLDFALTLVLAAPALVLVALAALAVKVTSTGPAFYTQTRVGRNGRAFTIVKLRTMRHRCEVQSGPRWSTPKDSRVTRVGHFLRATHLDELPQLWNVLRGDMSLVGPRPERPEIIAAQNLDQLVPGYGDRLLVKPGITGLAQTLLPPDSDIASVRLKVAHDQHYVENRGPWLDLRILFGTPLSVLGLKPRMLRRALALPLIGETSPQPARPEGSDRLPREYRHVPVTEWRAKLAAACAATPTVPAPRPATNLGRAEARTWFRATLVPALRELAAELRQQGRTVRVSAWRSEEVALRVWDASGKRELDLKFRFRAGAGGLRAYARELFRDACQDFVHEHSLDRPFPQLRREDVIAFVVARYQAALARRE